MARSGSRPNGRGRREDYPINDRGSPIQISNFNAVGGSTILYAAHFPRFHPSDFRVRTLDGVADDWPIDYATLAPYYDTNARMMGVAGLAGDPAGPAKQPPLPPVPLGRLGETLARGFNRLGWHWWPSDSAIATREYEGRAACINLGPCIMGCAQGAKASTDVTYWPVAIRNGRRAAHALPRARDHARRARHGERRDLLRRATAPSGTSGPRSSCSRATASARRACCSTRPRRASRTGSPTRSGLVGRNLMFHPYALVTGIFPDALEGYKGPTGCCIISQEFYETDRARGFARGYSFEIVRGMGPVSTSLFAMSTGRAPWGVGHHEAYARVWDRTAGMVAICEDLPEEHNRVTLDPELVDSDGIPAPKIDYRLGANSQRMIEHAVARGREVLEAAGAKETVADAPLSVAGWHLMGTARMGTDPETSVVNEWGRCHDVRNLFIVDGSIFVTSAAVNPTHTIQALALYIGDAIQRNLSNLFD